MRHALPLALLLLVGCHDDEIFAPTSLPTPPDTRPRFEADAGSSTSGVAVRATQRVDEDEIDLAVEAEWIDELHTATLNSADVFLRIDPGAAAEVTVGGGSYCDFDLEVAPTGQPGEWRIHHAPLGHCGCSADIAEYGAKNLAVVRVRIGNPGTWRVDLASDSTTPVCACDTGCAAGVTFRGGRLIDAAARQR